MGKRWVVDKIVCSACGYEHISRPPVGTIFPLSCPMCAKDAVVPKNWVEVEE